ncbi:conjugative transfer relaxase/helicase TraI domain-containing protein [Pantoea agglomerans]|uniref:conjugative transfer relaxase/helicase TraI domain-containing protein n=1 Tax=Enterobacter agglomerans TaxID=549 RepID=UPI00320BA662
MSVANVKAKAPKKTSAKKVTDAEQAAVKAALEAAPVEYAPLSVFVMSLLNARTIPYSTESVESMAATIKSVGLLQNLVAHELPDGELAVAAGGKRLTALNLLLSQQFLTPDYPVPFKRVSPEMAALVSYIENAQRSDMHAAEQIASFGALAYQGKTPEQIGAELGYSTRHVQRMLKLANLAPSLLKLLADDQLTVEQCQTLCLEDDQARQVRVYEEVKASWHNLPVTMLRKLITDKEISITDKRFLFVGREAYEAAGGVVREDLFSQQEGEGTADSALLETLAVLPSSLTVGQRDASALILQSADRFTAVQGYAGVGKTTQFNAVKTAIDTLPETVRPIVIGLGPTHRAVKEMRSIGIEGQTMKSFLLDWQQRTAAGEKVSYGNTLFLIDEASMLGNQDTAEAMRAIAAGNGRAVMVGDVAQLESPESGAPFRLLQERSPIDVAVMKEIKRQLSDDLRGAVYSVIENKAAAALEKIDRVSPAVVSRQAGSQTPVRSVVEIPPPPKDENGNELPGPDGKRAPRVHDAIVADYMSRTPSARAETLIVVSLNDDRRAINAGIHQAMTEAKELGGKAVQVPVLERVSGGRHDFNKFDAWRVGHVVLSGERYLNVIGLDRGTNNVLLRDEDGRMRYYSPAELNATEIEVFRKETLELRTGDSIRMNKTQRQAGHAAHEQYRVAALHDNGDVVLQGTSGKKVISPGDTLADRHIDYAWAVTGHGAQGASSRFVIALESATGRRGMISGMRSFYISLSRAKEHVQVYSDNVKLWKEALIREEKGFKTAHDALSPEIERKQARAIWSMGQPLAKTAIGRAFLNSHALRGWPVTARIIPPTRKYPEPHLALPAYDGNGKAAGLTLIPLRHEKGTLNPGQPRQLATDSAQAALLQKSRNGETVIVSDLAQGLIVARDRPEAGVVILTGRQQPSAQLLRVAGGHAEQAMRPDATLLSLVKAELQDMLKMLPLNEPAQDERETLRTALEAIKDSLVLPEVHREEKGERALDSAEIRKTAQLLSELPVIKLPETSREGMDKNTLPAELAERIAEAMQHKLSVLPAETAPDYTSLVRQASEELAQAGDMPPDSAVRAVLNALSGSRLPSGITSQGEMPAGGSLPASVVRHVQDELAAIQVTGKHMHETISEREVASVARELDRQVQVTLPPEVRGREPERELPSPEITRHIQKER